MYDREYQDETLNFEPSGGLWQASLVMQDKETDSYWSIMSGDSIAGRFRGTALRELPAGRKMQWKDWVAEHPDTLVLSVEGKEHGDYGYENYFDSEDGFRGMEATDKRLKTKQSVYSFQMDGKAYAVPFEAYQEGEIFQAGGTSLFFYRPTDVAIFYSTHAFTSPGGFEKREDRFIDKASGARFDPQAGSFTGGKGEGPARLQGFDTFWYNWSLIHPDTEVLGLDKVPEISPSASGDEQGR